MFLYILLDIIHLLWTTKPMKLELLLCVDIVGIEMDAWQEYTPPSDVYSGLYWRDTTTIVSELVIAVVTVLFSVMVLPLESTQVACSVAFSTSLSTVDTMHIRV